jgi:hypothetical protein
MFRALAGELPVSIAGTIDPRLAVPSLGEYVGMSPLPPNGPSPKGIGTPPSSNQPANDATLELAATRLVIRYVDGTTTASPIRKQPSELACPGDDRDPDRHTARRPVDRA